MSKELIESLDYSHGYTIDKDHAIELYNAVKKSGAKRIVEIGSYLGISTVALAVASKENEGNIRSVDLCDEIKSDHRQKYWNRLGIDFIESIDNSCVDFLNTKPDVDFIFHDAAHGNAVIPEYQMCWEALNEGGVLAIHDIEQVYDYVNFIRFMKPKNVDFYPDKKGRVTAIIWK